MYGQGLVLATLLPGALFLYGNVPYARSVTISALPDADTFVRSFAPDSNYGLGGALSVSGATATNSLGDQNGLFVSLIRFPMSNVVSSFNSIFGTNDWLVTRVRLSLTEMAVPDNAMFNRGAGAFEVRWIAADGWVEGTGKPNMPAPDGLVWDDLPGLTNASLDISLGVFTNAAADTRAAFTLSKPDRFLTDIHSGGEVTLYLTAASPEIGFTFNSRNFGNTNVQPALEITAEANPRPVVNTITRLDGNVIVSFSVATNWTYRVQRTESLGSVGMAVWSDVFTLLPQTAPTNISFSEPATNGQSFYRLSVSP